MKILHVIDRLNAGGAERVCVTLAALFQQQGYDVTVLELLAAGVLQQQLPSGVIKIQLNRKSRFDVVALYRLGIELKKYDVIHIHMRHVYRYVFLANVFVGKRLVFHDHFNHYPTDWIQRNLFRFLLRNHIYISVQERGCEWAIHTLRLKVNDVYRLPNVILKLKTESTTTRLNKLVLVSNIKPEKNIEFIAPLVRELIQKRSDIYVDIIGNVVDEKYFSSIVQRLRNDELNHHVSFQTGVSNVQNILSEYTLGLHFSKLESGPLVLLEYLAQDLPFIAFSTGEIAHNLQLDLPDFFVSDFEVKSWSEKILERLTVATYTPSLEYFFKKHNDTHQYFQKCLTIYQNILS